LTFIVANHHNDEIHRMAARAPEASGNGSAQLLKKRATMMDGVHNDHASEGSRRHFLKTAAVAGGAATVGSAGSVWAQPPASTLPMVTLGKTGQKVPVLGMGTSWVLQPSFVQAALHAGIRYIDTSETYEGGTCESTLGEVLERTKMRKDVYLVTKNSRAKVGGPQAIVKYEARLNASLERLRTDYVDCYYLHGVEGREIPLFSDPDVKAAFEKLKRSGKIRFCGLSCHDARLPEIVTAAAKCGWIDQIMIQYNYRTMTTDAVRRALDTATQANLAIVAMKTQGGAGRFREATAEPKFKEFVDKGFKKEAAAIKTVFSDHRVHAVVSEMTTRDMLRENIAASRDHTLKLSEQKQLEEYRQATAHLYCHGCGHHCEPAAGGVAVAQILRYLRYHEVYGKRQRARELYQALPAEARAIAQADLAAAQAACPHGLPVVELLNRADRHMS
jgi:predicted aldo/keto reductase-like oxidoreductase